MSPSLPAPPPKSPQLRLKSEPLGFVQFRVRHHDRLVRIEIAPNELPRALDPAMAARFVQIFKQLGFSHVALDLEGYRQGSLNAEVVQIQKQPKT